MNNTPRSPEDFASVHHAFEATVAAHPDRVAVYHRDQKITYRELNGRANSVAAYLRRQGVVAGDIVGIHMPRCLEMVIAMLAIAKNGAAYLPVDPANPARRSGACLDQAECRFVIADGAVDTEILANRALLRTDRHSELFAAQSSEFDSHRSDRSDRFYVMFSSGTTGDPKGIVIPHRAVLRLVIEPNFIDIRPDDRILQLAPPSFDAATLEFWGALLNGAGLVIYSGSVFDPNRFRKEMDEHQVSILWLTAALFHLVSDGFIEAIDGLRVLLAGGDVLNVNNVNKVLDHVPGITLINGYGPTENTTFTCCHVMTRDNRPWQTVPIGRPVSGTAIHLLDENLQPVAPGQKGELFTSGDGVALGYLARSADDARFFHNSSIAAGLIYRTGDIARENNKGEVEFIGRADNQIKLRGFRVTLEEIKLNLTKVDGVADAIVTKKVLSSGDQILVAFVQCQNGRELTPDYIREQLMDAVPSYMVPDQIVLNDSLPITNNGKLDRKSVEQFHIEEQEVG